jgi:hypothetical protein
MKAVRLLSLAAIVAASLAPNALASGRKPGSALVYPIQVSHAAGFFTIISVTNTNLAPTTPVTNGGGTNVHFEYVNVFYGPELEEANFFIPESCAISNVVDYLTGADTLSVLTLCHNPVFNQGYLVISAENPDLFDTAWKHDFLIGSEFVINPFGGAYELNAIPFSAGAALANHQATDRDGDKQLDFDGTDYEQVPDTLYADVAITDLFPSLSLINLTGGVSARNSVHLDVWNDNEVQTSVDFVMGCWFEQPLARIHFWFNPAWLKLNVSGDDPSELDVNCNGTEDFETTWFRIDSTRVATFGGTTISNDGALLGALTGGGPAQFNGLSHNLSTGKLLWESVETQSNGVFLDP